MTAESTSESHEPGRLLYDPATDKVGEYRDRAGPYVMLRPVGGEWSGRPIRRRCVRPRTGSGSGRVCGPPTTAPGACRRCRRRWTRPAGHRGPCPAVPPAWRWRNGGGGGAGGVRPQRRDRRERPAAPAPAEGAPGVTAVENGAPREGGGPVAGVRAAAVPSRVPPRGPRRTRGFRTRPRPSSPYRSTQAAPQASVGRRRGRQRPARRPLRRRAARGGRAGGRTDAVLTGRRTQPEGRTPTGVQPRGCGPQPSQSPREGGRPQTAMATSASAPFSATTTVRSAVAPGTSARTVHVPSAA